ncbi:MAG: hypothetical protein ACOY3Y_03565 [Acidobacteriota bacterium]
MTQRLDVLVHPASLVVEDCCECGIYFAMPRDFQERRRFDGKNFFCPAGHPQHYTEPEKAKLERQLKQAEDRAAREAGWRRHAESTAHHAERRRRALQGVVTRTKRRIAAGVCPCCKRHFQNLEDHMKSRHPKYAHDEAGA